MTDQSGRVELSDYIAVRMSLISFDRSVFPNPCSEILYINSKEKIISSVELFDLTGKLVHLKNMSLKTEGPAELKISNLAEQIYIVKINIIGPGNTLTSECRRIIKI